MIVNIFTTDKKYQIIYADPPWKYGDKNCSGAAEHHYNTMTLQDIEALPVNRIAADDSVLFLWATYPQLDCAIELIKAWGFTYKTIAFQWVKLNKAATNEQLIKIASECSSISTTMQKMSFFGLGRWTRGNTECCLLATKGKPKRVSANVGQLIYSPLRNHSEKPPETRDKCVELIGEDASKIELFARQVAKGWDCWGNEV